MYEMWLIIEREFLQRVRSRSFILSTILLPLFMVGIFAVPIFMEVRDRGGVENIVVVDESPAGLGDRIVERLGAEPASEREVRFLVEHVRAPLASVRDSLGAAVVAEEIDGYLWIPAEIEQGAPVVYRARNVTDDDVQDRIGEMVSEAVQVARLDEAGLRMDDVATLLRPVPVEASRITAEGEEAGGGLATRILATIAGFVLYMVIIIYGAQVMQSVQEEKTNRIAEVLVSSVRSSHLMLGKVLGVCAVALLQIAIWVGLFLLVAAQRDRIAGALGVPVEIPDLLGLGVDAGTVATIGAFALLGFFLYAALFAAAGAAAESSEDAQRFTFPLITPLILPILVQQQIISDPQGTLAVVLGWVPFTSPIVMPMRLGAGAVSTLEILGSLFVLAASAVLLGTLAGKIYRVGILSTGKRPTLRELGRWLRTA